MRWPTMWTSGSVRHLTEAANAGAPARCRAVQYAQEPGTARQCVCNDGHGDKGHRWQTPTRPIRPDDIAHGDVVQVGMSAPTWMPSSLVMTESELRAKLAAAEQRAAQMEAVLRRVEWSGVTYRSMDIMGRWACPVCSVEKGTPHLPYCALASALRATEPSP